MSSPVFGYQFPSLRGVQAGRNYYISQCPLRLLPRLFSKDDSDLPVEARAQRTLNHERIPEITRYILDNREEYVFSAITASIDGDVLRVEFECSPVIPANYILVTLHSIPYRGTASA